MKCSIINKINDCTLITEDTAKVLLRVVLGVLILLHGIFKLMNPGAVDFVAGAFENAHLPGFLAYLYLIGEIVAPIMLIIGYQVKIASLLVATTMVIAIALVHLGQLFTLGATGGSAIELQLMYLFGAIAVFGLGAGKCTLFKKKGTDVTPESM